MVKLLLFDSIIKTMKKLIWVIDDDEGILEVTKIVLEEAGFDVQTIDNMQDFNDNLKKELPACLLLDISISGMSGIDISQNLKSNAETKNIPVIIMSANPDIEQKSKEARADSFLKKPFDIDVLEKKVREYAN